MKYLLTIGLLLFPSLGLAQAQCADRQALVDGLANRYGESRQSIGLATGSQVVEVFANLETGTWTILVTRPSGVACMAASGGEFQHLNEELKTGIRI